jgi:ribosomal protein S19
MLKQRSRAGWKIPYISPIFFSKNFLKSKKFYTNRRNTTIAPHFIGKKISVYSGKVLKTVSVKKLLVGGKLGQYSISKVFGEAIGVNMALKEKRKKEDKKKGKKSK